jgi:hypothetical protein
VSFEVFPVRLTSEDRALAFIGAQTRLTIFTLDLRSQRAYLTGELINLEV